jgi:hypothetical protein
VLIIERYGANGAPPTHLVVEHSIASVSTAATRAKVNQKADRRNVDPQRLRVRSWSNV